MSNSVDPDETAHYDLHCLQKPIIIVYGIERVKTASRYDFRAYSKRPQGHASVFQNIQ